MRASNWRAILLLDDAEVFLAARDPHDLRRNTLVSIFLHHLEYADGFLFMTTNQPQDLDLALESRIHMSIKFNDLDLVFQREIWKNFIQEIPDRDLPDKEKKMLQSFVEGDDLRQRECTNMNGRQIRNCLNAALALAQAEGRPLTPEHVRNMLMLGKEFTDFMYQSTMQGKDKLARTRRIQAAAQK